MSALGSTRRPTSSLLFGMGTELLQAMVNLSCQKRTLVAPLPSSIRQRHSINNARLSFPAHNAKRITSEQSSNGSQSELCKIMYYDYNCISDKRMEIMANTLACEICTLPFGYVGLTQDTTKPTIEDLLPLMSQIQRTLNASTRFWDTVAISSLCSLKLQKSV
jgi:hypothetical protein